MYENIVNHYMDFPKPGIDFIDVMPLLQNKEVFQSLTRDIAQLVTTPNVATMEARGFLFAAPLLIAAPQVQTLIPLRKAGKLPFAQGDLRSVCIEKEYGKDEMFYRLTDLASCHPEGDTIELTLLDDLLATGGTALGIAQALNREQVTIGGRQYHVHVKECIFLVELTNLPGRKIVEQVAPVRSLIKIEENI